MQYMAELLDFKRLNNKKLNRIEYLKFNLVFVFVLNCFFFGINRVIGDQIELNSWNVCECVNLFTDSFRLIFVFLRISDWVSMICFGSSSSCSMWICCTNRVHIAKVSWGQVASKHVVDIRRCVLHSQQFGVHSRHIDRMMAWASWCVAIWSYLSQQIQATPIERLFLVIHIRCSNLRKFCQRKPT